MPRSELPVRVLLVDDSAIIRRLLIRAVNVPQIEIVGTAADGRAALEQFDRLHPDVVVTDLEMPEMDGLALLRELRRRPRDTAVLVFSALTHRAAQATIDALLLGADDYMAKPDGAGSLVETEAALRNELVRRILAISRRRRMRNDGTTRVDPIRPARTLALVAIGASTGGPQALRDLLAALPGRFPVPVLAAQHMPAQFTALLARRLDHSCALRVVEACHDMPIRAGVAHIASGGFHLRLREGEASWVAALTREDSETECRPSVDHLFASAAAVCGSGLAAVVLTGMGRDGLAGARDVVARGGRVLIQDEASSVVWGMPGAVARHDLASFIGSPTAIAAELERCVAAGSSCALKSIAHGGPR